MAFSSGLKVITVIITVNNYHNHDGYHKHHYHHFDFFFSFLKIICLKFFTEQIEGCYLSIILMFINLVTVFLPAPE